MVSDAGPASDDFIERHTRELSLNDGTRLRLRPIRGDDKEGLTTGFDRLSDDARYRRFLAPTGALTPAMLAYFTEIDYHDHFAWVALALDEPDESGVAVARYVRDGEDPEVAEPAVAVIDDYQGRGLGSLLLRLLTATAVEHGVKRFRATLLRDNRAMFRLFEESGADFASDAPGLLRAEMPLPNCGIARARLLESLLRHACDGSAQTARRVLTGITD